jgi:hypothetical protein
MQASRLMLVQYESLVENPGIVLNEIYKFIGQDAFQHDFDNVHQETVSYDEKMGTPGLHSVLMVCIAPTYICVEKHDPQKKAGPFFGAGFLTLQTSGGGA